MSPLSITTNAAQLGCLTSSYITLSRTDLGVKVGLLFQTQGIRRLPNASVVHLRKLPAHRSFTGRLRKFFAVKNLKPEPLAQRLSFSRDPFRPLVQAVPASIYD